MTKIISFKDAINFSESEKENGKTVGLIVGSFDILHLGHANLFSLAKKHCDVLIVGLDNDKTITLVKGETRPINNFSRRAKLLEQIQNIDKIFEIKRVAHHDSERAKKIYSSLLLKISPTHIFTHKTCDTHWHKKRDLAKENNIVCVLDKTTRITNSGTIIEQILAGEL